MSMSFEEMVENVVDEENDLVSWEFYRVIAKDGCHYDVGACDYEEAIAESGYDINDVECVKVMTYKVTCTADEVFKNN